MEHKKIFSTAGENGYFGCNLNLYYDSNQVPSKTLQIWIYCVSNLPLHCLSVGIIIVLQLLELNCVLSDTEFSCGVWFQV
jgi:hypothetical protein